MSSGNSDYQALPEGIRNSEQRIDEICSCSKWFKAIILGSILLGVGFLNDLPVALKNDQRFSNFNQFPRICELCSSSGGIIGAITSLFINNGSNSKKILIYSSLMVLLSQILFALSSESESHWIVMVSRAIYGFGQTNLLCTLALATAKVSSQQYGFFYGIIGSMMILPEAIQQVLMSHFFPENKLPEDILGILLCLCSLLSSLFYANQKIMLSESIFGDTSSNQDWSISKLAKMLIACNAVSLGAYYFLETLFIQDKKETSYLLSNGIAKCIAVVSSPLLGRLMDVFGKRTHLMIFSNFLLLGLSTLLTFSVDDFWIISSLVIVVTVLYFSITINLFCSTSILAAKAFTQIPIILGCSLAVFNLLKATLIGLQLSGAFNGSDSQVSAITCAVLGAIAVFLVVVTLKIDSFYELTQPINFLNRGKQRTISLPASEYSVESENPDSKIAIASTVEKKSEIVSRQTTGSFVTVGSLETYGKRQY